MFESPASITATLDEIIEYLNTDDRNRQALMHANLLLTNLMRLLRPILTPTKTKPSKLAVHYRAEQTGYGVGRVRCLRDAVIRGVSEIERGQYSAARLTFKTARDAWTGAHSGRP